MIADKPAVEQQLAAALLPHPDEGFGTGAFRVPLADDQDPTMHTDAGRPRMAHLGTLERAYVSAEAARLAWAARLDAGLLGPDALTAAPGFAPPHLRHEVAADYLDDTCRLLFGASWRGADPLDSIAARLVVWGAQRRVSEARGHVERPADGAHVEDSDAAVVLAAARSELGRPYLA